MHYVLTKNLLLDPLIRESLAKRRMSPESHRQVMNLKERWDTHVHTHTDP